MDLSADLLRQMHVVWASLHHGGKRTREINERGTRKKKKIGEEEEVGGGSHTTFYNLALKVTQKHFCHLVYVKEIT